MAGSFAAGVEAAPQALREGYAFDEPRILAQQRLFGLAHGIVLLAAVCGAETPTRNFAEWNERHAETIEASQRELARYHFGARSMAATPLDIARAIGLKDTLPVQAGSKELAAACATFAEALEKPRYDLSAQFRLHLLASRLASATRTEAETVACRGMLAEGERTRLDQALATWHADHDPGVNEAKAVLQQRWPELRIEGGLEKWLADAREHGRKAATVKRCETMPMKLTTKTMDPDHAFDPKAHE